MSSFQHDAFQGDAFQQGAIPGVGTGVTVSPGVGSLVITGFAPTVTVTAAQFEFDTHDGRPRTDVSYEARRNREKLNQEDLRAAIERAMALAMGEPANDTPKPTPAPPRPERPLNREQRRSIAVELLRTQAVPDHMATVRKLEVAIRTIEQQVRAREAYEREMEEEDELILLLAA